MRLSTIAVSFGLAVVASANPLLGSRAVSPDNSCGLTGAGNNKGYTCNAAAANGGRCCSANGWCGNTDAYCGTGCQAAYGSCGTQTTTKKTTTKSTAKTTTTSVKTTTTSAKKTTTTTTTQKVTTTSTKAAAPSGTSTTNCGPQYGNAVCASGLCCSQYGWCSNDDAHCGTGCQPQFGSCGLQSTTTTSKAGSSTTASFNGSPTGSTLNCGPAYGNAVCLSGLCCSSAGWCNNDPDHCGTGCQPQFGACGNQNNHPTGPANSTTTCGPSNGYATCAKGLCCSIGGNCGTGEDFCADPFNCQFGYGDCDSSQTPAGTSTINDPRPLLGSVSYTQDIYDCTAPNVVALTFDDGPLNYTDQILDLLKTAGYHATFFVTGNNVGKGAIDVTSPWTGLIKRMIAEGHQVASHTWSHYDLGGLESADRIQQMVKNERAIANLIGKYPTYMRPPFSSCSGDCQTDMQKLGYHRVYFDLDTQDYENDSPTQIQNSKNIVNWYLGNETNGQNVLSLEHDGHYQTAYNLTSYYFSLIKAKGWKGVSVGECLQDPQTNWYRIPGTGQGTA